MVLPPTVMLELALAAANLTREGPQELSAL
jgi:hypothetical protein